MNHPMMVWAKADKVFGGVVLLVAVNVMEVYDFVEAAQNTGLSHFSVSFEINIVRFSLVVCFV
jgi:hypothetical protein